VAKVSKESVEDARAKFALHGLIRLFEEGEGGILTRSELFVEPPEPVDRVVVTRLFKNSRWQKEYLHRMVEHGVLYTTTIDGQLFYGIQWLDYVKKIINQEDINGGNELLWFLFPNSKGTRMPDDILQFVMEEASTIVKSEDSVEKREEEREKEKRYEDEDEGGPTGSLAPDYEWARMMLETQNELCLGMDLLKERLNLRFEKEDGRWSTIKDDYGRRLQKIEEGLNELKLEREQDITLDEESRSLMRKLGGELLFVGGLVKKLLKVIALGPLIRELKANMELMNDGMGRLEKLSSIVVDGEEGAESKGSGGKVVNRLLQAAGYTEVEGGDDGTGKVG